jgi:hypothetical protein
MFKRKEEEILGSIMIGERRLDLVEFIRCTEEQYNIALRDGKIKPTAFYIVESEENHGFYIGDQKVLTESAVAPKEEKIEEYKVMFGNEENRNYL